MPMERGAGRRRTRKTSIMRNRTEGKVTIGICSAIHDGFKKKMSGTPPHTPHTSHTPPQLCVLSKLGSHL